MHYQFRRGQGVYVIEAADSVSLVLDDGTEFDLQYRRSDGEVSLSTDGQLLIEPRSSNVVRLSVKPC